MAVGIVADDAKGSAADAGFYIVELIDDLRLEAVALGPAAVHTHEHFGPIAGFGSAGAGLDAQVGVAGVLCTAEHGPHLKRAERFLDGVQFAFEFRVKRGVFLGHFRHSLDVFRLRLQLLIRLE